MPDTVNIFIWLNENGKFNDANEVPENLQSKIEVIESPSKSLKIPEPVKSSSVDGELGDIATPATFGAVFVNVTLNVSVSVKLPASVAVIVISE